MYFQLLRNHCSARKLAFLSLLFTLLIPAHPFHAERSHWIELVDDAEGKEAYELLKIYSIVKSHGTDMSEASAWALAKAILEESIKGSLDPLLVLAVINVESRFQHTAVSTEGARGLMQIRPFVATALAEEADLQSWEGEESLDDPLLNIKLGIFYLCYLQRSFGDLKLALTAYKWGPTEIKNRLEGEEGIPFGYALKVLSAYNIYRKDGHQTHKIPWNQPEFHATIAY